MRNCAVGPIARQEAGANLRAKLFIASAALTARSRQPCIEATSRETKRLAQPTQAPLRDAGPIKLPCRSAITQSAFYSATSKYSSPSNTN